MPLVLITLGMNPRFTVYLHMYHYVYFSIYLGTIMSKKYKYMCHMGDREQKLYMFTDSNEGLHQISNLPSTLRATPPPVYLHVSFCVLQYIHLSIIMSKKKYNFVSHGNSRIEITCSQTATKYCIQSVIYPPPDPNMQHYVKKI